MPEITFELDTSSLQNALKRLLSATQDTKAVMADIGLALVENAQARFRSNIDPDGQAWKPSERARREGGRTLLDHGHLRDSITYVATNDRLEVGTNAVYAPIHQFGGKTPPHKVAAKRAKALRFNGRFAKSVNHPGSDIPARPYLGFSPDDEREVLGIIEDHIQAALP